MKWSPEDILTIEDVWLLYDHITNLQKENKREKIQKELCESLLDECDEHNKYLQQIIDKAIEYIKKNKHIDDYGKWIIEDDNDYLLNILEESNKDE